MAEEPKLARIINLLPEEPKAEDLKDFEVMVCMRVQTRGGLRLKT